mmetsp:Transcript_16927/g.36929  ORF Transcript_16927/g.36929 Transcript_16927/m.36929 type:complete len:464 (+) Transcript_16927:72-1463(+)
MKSVASLFGKSRDQHGGDNDDNSSGFPLPPPPPEQCELDKATMAKLQQHGYSPSLIEAMQEIIRTRALRYFVIDNSSSMTTQDGHQIFYTDKDPQQHQRRLNDQHSDPSQDDSQHSNGSSNSNGSGPFIEILDHCRRWDELVTCIEHVIEISALLSSPTRFRLLNKSYPAIYESNFDVCHQYRQRTVQKQVDHAMAVIRAAEPEGSTPLTLHVSEIYRQVQQMESELRAQNRRVSVTICTDGLPTSPHFGDDGEHHQQEFVKALTKFQSLPVSIVFRLCTDDPKVVEFYHSVNHKLGCRSPNFTIDVLNDYEHEAQEVYKKNPWLTYSLQLHRMREMALHDGLLSLLDVQTLATNRILATKLCQLVLGQEALNTEDSSRSNYSSTTANMSDAKWKNFLQSVETAAQDTPKQWNPIYKRPKKLISAKKLAGGVPASFLKHPHLIQHKHHHALGHGQLNAIIEDS